MRAMTKERVRAASLADSYKGLPHGITHLELWDQINDARASLRLNSDQITLLGYYIKRTRALDWTPGHEPILAWPKFEICYDLDWSEDKLSRIEASLCRIGLIAFRDSANCKRRVRRESNGAISGCAAGISLAPLGARAEEIFALAHQHRENKTKLRRVYSELFEARSMMRDIQTHPDLCRSACEAISELLDTLPRRKDAAAELSTLTGLLTRAKAMISHLSAMIGLPAAAKAETIKAVTAEAAPIATSGPATLRPLHRRIAEHKDPHSNKPEEDRKLVDLLAAAPVTFRSTLEVTQERAAGLPWEMVLSETIDTYGRDLALSSGYLGRLKSQFGITGTLSALFGLGKMAEKGAEIRNPAGYAMSLARRVEAGPTARSSAMGPRRTWFSDGQAVA
ncbi:helix-turn-helix domain-containing protein [Paracoccus sp. T5]|uniref:helix-turn-helix domain-containing protein n=1 Tax=Paracoccus sp. T5 TaxID=3402161 RepID=UPI003AE5E17D